MAATDVGFMKPVQDFVTQRTEAAKKPKALKGVQQLNKALKRVMSIVERWLADAMQQQLQSSSLDELAKSNTREACQKQLKESTPKQAQDLAVRILLESGANESSQTSRSMFKNLFRTVANKQTDDNLRKDMFILSSYGGMVKRVGDAFVNSIRTQQKEEARIDALLTTVATKVCDEKQLGYTAYANVSSPQGDIANQMENANADQALWHASSVLHKYSFAHSEEETPTLGDVEKDAIKQAFNLAAEKRDDKDALLEVVDKRLPELFAASLEYVETCKTYNATSSYVWSFVTG